MKQYLQHLKYLEGSADYSSFQIFVFKKLLESSSKLVCSWYQERGNYTKVKIPQTCNDIQVLIDEGILVCISLGELFCTF